MIEKLEIVSFILMLIFGFMVFIKILYAVLVEEDETKDLFRDKYFWTLVGILIASLTTWILT